MTRLASSSMTRVADVRGARCRRAPAPQVGPDPRLGPRRVRRQARRTRAHRLRRASRLPALARRRPRRAGLVARRARGRRGASRCRAACTCTRATRADRGRSRRACSSRSARRSLIITNAAGGLNPTLDARHADADPRSHRHAARPRRCAAPTTIALGPRFPDMTRRVRRPSCARSSAQRRAPSSGITLEEGVYVAMPGPTYETPAEVQHAAARSAPTRPACRRCPRSIVARHMGARVLGISCITNQAAGITGQELSHAEVTETATRVRATFERAARRDPRRARRDARRARVTRRARDARSMRATDARSARVRAVLEVSASARAVRRRTARSSTAPTSRTRRIGWRCAPSATRSQRRSLAGARDLEAVAVMHRRVAAVGAVRRVPPGAARVRARSDEGRRHRDQPRASAARGRSPSCSPTGSRRELPDERGRSFRGGTILTIDPRHRVLAGDVATRRRRDRPHRRRRTRRRRATTRSSTAPAAS